MGVTFMDAMQTAGALAFDVDPSMVKVQITEYVADRRLSIDLKSAMHRRLAVVNIKAIYTISIPSSEVAQVEAVEARLTSIASSTSETNPLKQEISTQMSALPAVSAVSVKAISTPNLSNASSTPALLSSPACGAHVCALESSFDNNCDVSADVDTDDTSDLSANVDSDDTRGRTDGDASGNAYVKADVRFDATADL